MVSDAKQPWSRTNQLIIAAAERLGVEATPLSSCHTDYFMRLCWPAAPEGPREVIVSKTRSPFLTELAQTLSNNKFISRELLATRGLPVIPGQLFDERCDPRRDADAAVRARALLAREHQVTVKPNWGNRGLGISAGVCELDELLAAYELARAHDRDEEVLIEPWIEGVNLRVAVIGGRVEAVAQIARPFLCGDGSKTAAELLAELNADERRGTWAQPGLTPLDRIAEDPVAARLAVLGLELDDVMPAALRVELCTDELETQDRSGELHPGWSSIAVEAATALGVDVAGVDLRGPAELFFGMGPAYAADGEAGVLEVNALPALHLHELPTAGRGRPVFEAFVAYCLQLPNAPAPTARVLV